MTTFTRWLVRKWTQFEQRELLNAYSVCFTGLHGRLILQHWIDNIYATVYEGNDPLQLAFHNGRRSFVHEVLQAVDMAEHPDKYNVPVIEENVLGRYTSSSAP